MAPGRDIFKLRLHPVAELVNMQKCVLNYLLSVTEAQVDAAASASVYWRNGTPPERVSCFANGAALFCGVVILQIY